jgi:rhodanese-related sulfurtransferase
MVDSTSVKKLNDPTIIDIRDKHSYLIQHEFSAVNIPLSAILNDEYKAVFERSNPKVILAYDGVKGHETWMLLVQMGYKEVYVMKI